MKLLILMLLYLFMTTVGGFEIRMMITRFRRMQWFLFGIWTMSFIWTLSCFIQMSIM